MKFVLASHNKGEARRDAAHPRQLGVEVVLQSRPRPCARAGGERHDLRRKRDDQSQSRHAGLRPAAIADDSGLCVDALGGAPGIYSARYGGLDDDKARYQLLLQNLRGAMTRAAHFHTSVVCCFPDGDVLTAEGECAGTIAYAPQGEGGFGYDPVFFVPQLRKTFAQLTPEEKNAISHRGNALARLQRRN